MDARGESMRQRGIIERNGHSWRARYWDRAQGTRPGRTFTTEGEARAWLDSAIDLVQMRRAAAALPALLDAVEVTAAGCWEWQGVLSNGYAKIGREGRKHYVHRLLLDLAGATPPPGHHVHHVCENRRCVNPAHLEALTPKQHLARHRSELS